MTSSQKGKHKGGILVLGDEPASLKLLFTLLTEDGYAVQERQLELESHLRFVKEMLPDLVLVDVRKPIVDGYGVCASLRNDAVTRVIPVIFICSIDRSINQAKALVSGAVDYVTDPFDAEEVLWRIQTHISLRRLRENLKSAACNHGAQPVAPNGDLEKAFREIHVLTQVTGRKHAEEKVRQAARELKKAQEALQSSERNLNQIINAIPTVIGVMRADGTPLYGNQGVTDYLGLTLEEMQRGDFRARIYHPEDLERLREARRVAFTRPVPFENEIRLLGKDGNYRAFLFRYKPLLDEAGTIDRWFMAALDIEDRKRAEDAQARQAGVRADVSAAFSKPAHLREIMSGCTEAIVRHLDAAFARIWMLNKDESMLELQASAGMYTRLDGSYSRIPVGDLKVGLIAREKKAHLTNDVMNDPRLHDKGWARDNGMVAFAGYPLVVEDRLIGVMALFARRPLSESILDTLASVADTIAQGVERKRAEEAVRRSEAFLAEGQSLSHMGSWGWNASTGKLIWSEEHFRILGLDPQDTKPSLDVFWERIHPEDRFGLRRTFESAIRDKRDFDQEFRIVTLDGSIRHLHGVGHAVLNKANELVEFIGSTMDITDRKNADAALQEARAELERVTRVTMMGELAASIAHEINQPLAGVVTSANAGLNWLAADPPNLARTRETLERILRDGTRGGEVLARIRTLLKRTPPAKTLVGMNQIVRDVLALTAGELRQHSIELSLNLASPLPAINGDSIQLQQVLLNLINNAIEAMAGMANGQRTLRITSRSGELDGKPAAVVEVSDSGVGFSDSDSSRLFEAFHTTKPQGMGMGLWISRSIIDDHHGCLTATSNDGPGSTFVIMLPKANQEQA
jgi:PAS domain S-box-containing protein